MPKIGIFSNATPPNVIILGRAKVLRLNLQTSKQKSPCGRRKAIILPQKVCGNEINLASRRTRDVSDGDECKVRPVGKLSLLGGHTLLKKTANL
jgi:hypothetical protein